MHARRAAAAAVVVLLGGLGLAACGSSNNNKSSASATSTSSSPSSTSTSPATGGKIDTSKPPVVIAINALKIPAVDLYTPYIAGAKAAGKVINAQGGFGGRKLEFVSCNTQYQPATAATCAHRTITKKPIASIGCDPIWPNAGLPVYAKSNTPVFNCPNVPADWTNPWSFGMTGGQQGDASAQVKWLCTRKDVKKIVYFTQDIPFQHTAAPKAMTPIAQGCGKSISYVYYPITGADITPQVQKAAAKKPDFVITLGGGALAINVYKLFKQAGIPADKIIGSGNMPAYQQVLKPGGAVMEGAYAVTEVTNWDDTSDPTVAAYLKAMQGAGYDAKDPNPETAYMWVMTIYTAAKKVGFDKFNPQTLKQFMDTANNVPVPLTRQIINPGPRGFPQIKQPYSQIVQWKNGKLTTIQEGTDNGWVKGY